MKSLAGVLAILTGSLALTACEGDHPEIARDPTPGETSTGPDTGKETAGGEKSGTRLRARYIAGGDGSREFAGWRDMERDEDCSFKQGDAGKLRCLPNAHPVLDYSDAECTKPIVTLPPQLDCNGNAPKYVIATDYSDPCIVTSRLFEMGKPTQVVVDPVYRSTINGCMPAGGGAMPTFYEVGAEVPMTELVEGSIVTE